MKKTDLSMSSRAGYKISRQRPRTNTSSLRTDGNEPPENNIRKAMRKSIRASNEKANRTIKRRRSASNAFEKQKNKSDDNDEDSGKEEEIVQCQDDTDEEQEAKSEEKKKKPISSSSSSSSKRKNKKQKTKKSSQQTLPDKLFSSEARAPSSSFSSSSSDETVLTAKKSLKHNKELHKVLSSSTPRELDQKIVGHSLSSSSSSTIDEYDANVTNSNMKTFNQFIINEATLMEKMSQEEANKKVSEYACVSQHPTFNLSTSSWFEAMQELGKKTCFDPTPVKDSGEEGCDDDDDDEIDDLPSSSFAKKKKSQSSPGDGSASTTKNQVNKKKTKGGRQKSNPNGEGGGGGKKKTPFDRKNGEKSLPVIPINYSTAITAAFHADVSKIYANILSKSEAWDKNYSEEMRRALREGASYDITDAHECPREHVNRMLVTPYGNFNECANGSNCKARVIYHLEQGLIGYRSPSEFQELASKPMSSVPLCKRLCYICHLALIHESILYQQNRGASCMTVNTPFMHHANQVGEYHQRHMIPHSIRTSDAEVQTPMVDVPKAGTQNSGGLVVPVRMWVRSEYVRSTSKPIRYLDERGVLKEETRPGLEEIVERFMQHDTNKPPVPPVNPYIYTRFLLEHRYDTWEILRYSFATKTSRKEFAELDSKPRIRSRGSTGVARLKERLKTSDNVVILPIYGALSVIGSTAVIKATPNINGMEHFPFDAIFQKDIRQTAARLEDILAGGRIFLHYLGKRSILNFIVDEQTPLHVFRDQLDSESAEDMDEEEKRLSDYYRPRRLYLAYVLRDEIVRTLRVVYPNSTVYNDPCFHGRFRVVDDWNVEHYGPIFDGHAPLDVDVSQAKLDRVCAEPVPYHYFASDVDFIRVRTEIVERENPRKQLAGHYSSGCEGVVEVHECNFAFMPFDSLRAIFAERKMAASTALKIIDRQQLQEILFPSFPDAMFERRFSELSSTHAIALSVAFRISVAQKIYAFERQNLDKIKAHKIDAENSFFAAKHSSREPLLNVSMMLSDCRDRLNRLSSFIYSHFALVERAKIYGFCSDKQMYQFVESSNDNQFLTHYEDVEPFDTITVHEGNLPDLSYLVTCVNFVVNTKEGSKGAENVQPVLLSIFRKMYPKCCQSRNAPHKHFDACTKNRSYLDLCRIAYRMMMMGGYRHIDQLPSLKTAINIYCQTSPDGYDRVSFLEQQRRYPHFFLLCMTEMLMFFTRQAPAYHDFILVNYPTYARYEQSVFHKADLVRRMHGEMSMEQIETFISGLEIFINEEPSTSARSEFHVFRPVRVDPIKKLVGHVQTINNIRHRQGYRRPDMPPILQRAVIHSVYTIKPNRDIDLVQLMLKMNDFYPGEVPPPDWQRNVKKCTTYIITWVLDMMECAEADEVIEVALNYIPPTDWEIFDLLINTLDVHYSVNVLNLPTHIRKKQEKALCERFGTDALDSNFNSINFANCCHVKTSHDTTADMPSPHMSYGQSKVCRKIYSGKNVCARKRRAVVERKINRNDKGQYTRIQNVMSLGDTNEIVRVCQEIASRPPDWQKHRRYRYQPNCGEEFIAQYHPFAGHVVQYTNLQGITEAYSICTNCGATAGFSRRLFDVNGFTCISCEEALVSKLNTPRCVACCCFIDIHTGQGKGTGKAKWKRFVVFNDSLSVPTYRYEVHFICANNGCYDLQTAKLNGQRVFSDRFAITSTSDLQRGRRVSAWKNELEIRMGFTDIRENVKYFYQNMALPNNRRSVDGSRRIRLASKI